MKRINKYPRGLDTLQKISVSLMAFMVLVTFVGANLHALLWQQSAWLVSTVLPAVVVDLTNEQREELQAPQLLRNATLDEAAKLKAQHMAENEYFSHYSPNGVSPWHWFEETGYVYAHAGENLAIHFTDSSEVVEAWMKSPTHRANIVNENYREIGVGTAKGTFDGYDTVYVVQLFGTPAYPPEVASETSSDVVITPGEEVTDQIALAEISATLDELSDAVERLTNDNERVVAFTEDVPTVLAESNDAGGTEPLEIEGTVTEDVSVPVSVVEPDKVTVGENAFMETDFSAVSSSAPQDVLVVESTITTSTGLTVASISESPSNKAGTTIVSMATQPNELLQFIYLLLGMLVMALLLSSAVFEVRQLHFVQVTYSIGLMIGMSALWYVHDLLTSGAVIA